MLQNNSNQAETEQSDTNANSSLASKPLRIALLGYRSAPHVGGQGIYINYLSKSLADMGHEVHVISGPPYPKLDERIKLIKLPSLDLFEAKRHHFFELRPRHLLSFTDFFEWWSMLTGGFAEPYTFNRRVVSYLKSRRDQYDVVHDNQSLGYGLLKLKKMGIPVLATVHHPITRDRQLALDAAPTWQLRLLVKRWYSFLGMQKAVINRLSKIVTVSKQSRRDISQAFGLAEEKIDVIHCGIDTQVFAPQAHIKRKPFRIMTTASADQPLKGLSFLLKAIASVKEQHPEIELLVIGKLKKGGQTAKLLRKLGIEDRVKFDKGISTEQLVNYYAEATIAVSPSLYEGFGLPMGEAMSCGTAVISSNGGALPEIVGDAGLMVQAGNSDALAQAIIKLLDSPELRTRLGQLGRQRILERFSWDVAAREFTQVYCEMINAAKTPISSTQTALNSDVLINPNEEAATS